MLITILCSIITAIAAAAIQHQVTYKSAFEEGEAHGHRKCRNRMFETVQDQHFEAVAPVIVSRLDRAHSCITAKAHRIREEHAAAEQGLSA